MKINLFRQKIVLELDQKYYLVKIVTKKENSSSKGKKLSNKKKEGQKPLILKKDKDFGGIPDIDPKKFIGCG